MLTLILIVLTLAFWCGYVGFYFRQEIYAWFDNRWGPQSRVEKPKRQRRGLYD